MVVTCYIWLKSECDIIGKQFRHCEPVKVNPKGNSGSHKEFRYYPLESTPYQELWLSEYPPQISIFLTF